MIAIVTITLCCMLTTSGAVDIIFENQPIVDGESIISKTGTFELGFFSPGSSKNRYVGIWYSSIMPRAVIWVANKHHPLNSTLGIFMFNTERMLLILNDTIGVTVIWSSEFSEPITDGIGFGQLLDTGNFVIKGSNKVEFIWQSLDFSENVFLPEIKFGKNFKTGKERYVTSWRSDDDPSLGEYSLRWEMNEYPQVYMMKGAISKTRLGPWNGENFAGMPNYKAEEVGTYKMVMVNSQKEAYFSYSLSGNTSIERGILTADGRLEFWHHNHDSQAKVWIQDWSIPLDNCDSYNMCGPYGSCNTLTSPYCGCLKGFERPEAWHPDNWTSGCQRKVSLDCKPNEGFLQNPGVKLPDTKGSWFREHMTLEECAVSCKNNCSCTAYANAYISLGKTGCLQWFGDLIDVRVYPQRGQDLYVRLAASELLYLQYGSKRRNHVIVDVLLSALVELIILGMIFALYAWTMRKRSNVDLEGRLILETDHNGTREMGETHLPFVCLSKIIMATDNFSKNNKLGEGGFGPVYKGMLEGQEFAVKRLSKSSHQGLQEFMNEIKCVAKLQHRNLVKLLGYCIQGDDTMLIYEYMPNKSLDRFIFDDKKRPLLDWSQRFSIIHGIARGLLYLHQDSRLRVIHRDLKADNILLDAHMNPKISDFGLARMFGAHETEANTHKVVGTLGYISPEYAKNGIFSVKSDIFSFGVLVLEIISGKKNRGFSHQHHSDNLLGHAWRLYREGKSLDLLDECLGDQSSWSVAEVTRSIMIGMLCVQQRAEDRPSMSSVLFMLAGEGTLPPPKRPGFFMEDNAPSEIPFQESNNNLTVTELCVR